MARERCAECGFDSDHWTDEEALEAIERLPQLWADAVSGFEDEAVQRRSTPTTWSIAEYTDHVREVLFTMRFVLDSAVEQPGIDLGDAPEPQFQPEPSAIDIGPALVGLGREANALRTRLGGLSDESWALTARVGADNVDAHWACRHAVHDAYHHLEDVRRLRKGL